MPCYFARMMNAYFNVESEEKWGDTSEEYSGVIYDFVNHTIDNFGIGSWTVNTTNEERQLFANWGYIIYSVVTNDVELHQFEDIEIEKIRNFWTSLERHNLHRQYKNFDTLNAIFNHSPTEYQEHYINILELENAQQSHVNFIQDPIFLVGENDCDNETDDEDDDNCDDDTDYDEMPDLISDTESEFDEIINHSNNQPVVFSGW